MYLRVKFFSVIGLLAIAPLGLAQDIAPVPETAGLEPSRSIRSFPLPTVATSKTLQALAEPTTVDWNKTPFEAALDSLEEKHHIEIWISAHGLREVGVSPDRPIHLQLKEIPLRSCLHLMLEPLGMVYLIDNEKLMVTSAKEARTKMTSRVYPVGDWSLKPDETWQLTEAIKCGLGLPRERQGIPPFALSDRTNTLTVRESPLMQEKVDEFLQALRDARSFVVAVPGTVPSTPLLTPAENKIERALSAPTSMSWSDTKLSEAMAELAKQHNINIWFDTEALAAARVGTDQLVTLQLPNISLQSCLQLLLEPLGLEYTIDRDVLVVTSREALEAKIVTRVYPIGDFCAVPNDAFQLLKSMECGLGKSQYYDGKSRMVVAPRLKTLIVRDTTVTQSRVQELLLALRDAQASNPKTPENALPPY